MAWVPIQNFNFWNFWIYLDIW